MMMDIFSSFDQNIFFSSSKTWMFILFINILLNSFWWITPFPNFWIKLKLDLFIFSQLSLTTSNSLKSFTFIISSIFYILVSLNILGLFPYLFSLSSHLIFSLNFSLPLWLSLLLSSFMLNWKTSSTNFLPSGAPSWLNPFLILVETSSILVRPITLGFRLAANMSAGHIILTLISSYFASSLFSSPLFPLLLFIQLSYFIFEIAISLIQAYIFCLLMSLYSNDHTP
uniref:ATP synthase F0 subunit 6 n=1 Tax=Oligobrachia dogieli TaxID=3095170 RepID=UPI002E77296E|nr:ATP synthase F0 subunit 6 [Oligobrachia dogieli]WPV72843.1 ATP synthase F0 subunit 6 [Oligobrachia dogieli]